MGDCRQADRCEAGMSFRFAEPLSGKINDTRAPAYSGSNVTWFWSSPSMNRFMLPLRRILFLHYRQVSHFHIDLGETLPVGKS